MTTSKFETLNEIAKKVLETNQEYQKDSVLIKRLGEKIADLKKPTIKTEEDYKNIKASVDIKEEELNATIEKITNKRKTFATLAEQAIEAEWMVGTRIEIPVDYEDSPVGIKLFEDRNRNGKYVWLISIEDAHKVRYVFYKAIYKYPERLKLTFTEGIWKTEILKTQVDAVISETELSKGIFDRIMIKFGM